MKSIIISLFLLAFHVLQANHIDQFYKFLTTFEKIPRENQDKAAIKQLSSYQSLPLIQDNTALFIWYGEARKVFIDAADTAWTKEKSLKRYKKTNFFLRSFTFERDTKLHYQFIIDGEMQLDPRNPRVKEAENVSWFAMKEFVPSTSTISSSAPHQLEQLIIGNIEVLIQLPVDYTTLQRYPSVYLLNSKKYLETFHAQSQLQHLQENQFIPHTIIIYLNMPDNLSLGYDRNFSEKTIPLIIQTIEQNYSVIRNQNNRTLLAYDKDVLQMLDIQYIHSDRLFRKIASQSGAFAFLKSKAYKKMAKKENNPLKTKKIINSMGTTQLLCVTGFYEKFVDHKFNYHKATMEFYEIATKKTENVHLRIYNRAFSDTFWQDTFSESIIWLLTH